MKKIKLISVFLTLFIATMFMYSCVDDDFENPPTTTIPIGEVKTISELKALFLDQTIDVDMTVYATVTMDDKSGNIYKTAYIQDGNDAIALHLDASGGIYQGDSIRLQLNGLKIGTYKNLFQIDAPDGNGFTLDNYITKIQTLVNTEPEVVTISDLQNMQGKLVKLENVQFVAGDTAATYADAENEISVSLTIEDGSNTAIVRTSGYAQFAAELTPTGSGSIIAVVGQYNSDMQLQIRSLDEVIMNDARLGEGGGGEGAGTGTKEDPYNVASAISNNTGLKQWVKGYIVGAAEFVAKGNTFHFEAPFGSVNTNVMIADSPDETNSSNVMVVQLPSGVVRDILNLDDNTGNHKKEVMVRGGLEDYFGQPGMKNTIGCIIDDTEYGDTEDIDAILYEDFASISTPYGSINIPGWKVVMEAGTKDWHGDGYNGQSAEISAYDTENPEASNIAWLITPSVDLSATTAPYLSFYSALKYHAGDILSVHVSTDYDGGDSPQTATWTELTSANIVTTSDPIDAASEYNYTESGNVDLSSYKAASVYVAFKYVGSGTGGQTTKYRVDNVKISE